MSQITLTGDPADVLGRLGKDRRLVPYGGANFGTTLNELLPDLPLVVPTDKMFVRSNGPVPVIDPATFRLAVDGEVERPLSLSLADLRAMPQVEFQAFLECAGNGRTRFDPVPEGTPWRNDAIGNVVWSGVPLRVVLDLAGVRDTAVDLVTQGGDFPEMRRGLPLAVGRQADTLLALRMNGEPLLIAHGGPLRLLVPGWAGIASTKWLTGVTAVDRPFAGFWNSDNYVVWDRAGAALRPVAEMPPKSQIVLPAAGSSLPAGATTIAGYAWSGYAPIAAVEVRVDNGPWFPAPFEQPGPRAWAKFSVAWEATPGRHVLASRAVDARRLTQPERAAWNKKGYQQNGVLDVAVSVEPQR